MKTSSLQAWARCSEPLSREGSLSCHTCCDTGPWFFFPVSSKGRPHSVASYVTQGGVEDLFNPDSHEYSKVWTLICMNINGAEFELFLSYRLHMFTAYIAKRRLSPIHLVIIAMKNCPILCTFSICIQCEKLDKVCTHKREGRSGAALDLLPSSMTQVKMIIVKIKKSAHIDTLESICLVRIQELRRNISELVVHYKNIHQKKFLCLYCMQPFPRVRGRYMHCVYLAHGLSWCIHMYNGKSVKKKKKRLIDYLWFYVSLENLSLICRRHHCRWRAAKI
jgi:hypothetical protein